MDTTIKVILGIIGISFIVETPVLIIPILAYAGYKQYLGKDNSNKNPKNWREAFDQRYGNTAKEMDISLRKESKKLTGSENYNTFSFSKARARSAGIHWYVWRTGEDIRVRPAHKNLNKVIVNYSEAPNAEALIGNPPGAKRHAGSLKGCRCYDEPLVSANDVTWPARVHYKGQIRQMSRSEFKKICKDDIF